MKAEQLKHLLKKYRVKQYEMADLCGVSVTTVNNWCKTGTKHHVTDAGIRALLAEKYGEAK